MQRGTMCAIASAFVLMTGSQHVSAQTAYPSKSVSMIIPFSPGASNDIIGRYLARELSEMWGKPVVPENKAGAGSAIGTNYVAKSPADGHTLLLSSSTYTTNAATMKNLAFDAEADLIPVTVVAKSETVLVVGSHTGVNTVGELVTLAKKKELLYGSPGVGATSDFATSRLSEALGIKMKRIPYKGGADVLIDLLGGRIDVYMGSISAVLPYIAEGKMKALALAGPMRVQSLPGVPTLSEIGVQDADTDQWWAVFVPKGTPSDVITKISADVSKVTSTPDATAFLAKQDAFATGMAPEDARKYVTTELHRWKEMTARGLIETEQ